MKNCKHIQDNFTNYIENSLENNDQLIIEEHIKKCNNCENELNELRILHDSFKNDPVLLPGKELDVAFNNMLSEEINLIDNFNRNKNVSMKPGKKIKLYNSIFFKVAASIILIIGGVFTDRLFFQGNGTELGSTAEIVDLKSEVNEMKRMLMFSMLKQESASQRIQAVGYSNEFNYHDPKVIEVLINTLKTDDSPNVRMATIKALENFIEVKEVTDALIECLENEKNAIVQIELINTLIKADEKRSVDAMQKIINNENTIEEVKTQAQIGVSVLI